MMASKRLFTVAALSALAVVGALGLTLGRGLWLHDDSSAGQGSARGSSFSTPFTAPRAAIDAAWSAPADRRAEPEGRHVFWEAERPTRTSYPATNPFAPRTPAEADALSGSDWIGGNEPKRSYFLEYDVEVPTGGHYRFYARKFWKHGPFRYRFDAGPFVPIGREI